MADKPVTPIFVRKQRRKMVARLVSLVSFVGIVALVIVSYLGTNLGNYTVELHRDKHNLAMSMTGDFENDQTTLLRAKGIGEIYPFTVYDFNGDTPVDIPIAPDETIDSEGGSHNGERTDEHGNKISDIYFAYTFFISNRGEEDLSYDVSLKITGLRKPTNVAVSLDEIVRVRLFENIVNDGEQTHDSTIFAKRSTKNITIDGATEARECVGDTSADRLTCDVSPNGVPRNTKFGRATAFLNDTVVTSYVYPKIEPLQVIRYTIVIWMEGADPDAKDDSPRDAGIAFAMEFNSKTGTYNN